MIGVVLLFAGGLLVTSSVWTLPLVIAGALMVLIAWIGHRLEGRLAVEWGEAGTQLEFRAQIRAAEVVPEAAAEPARRLPEPDDAGIIEGEAHTVEIEVAALKTLIAAAEASEGETAQAATAPGETAQRATAQGEAAQAEASAHAARILRVAHGGGRSSKTG